ncbi:MAG: class I SAM-dependent methyltransferase family protein [Candidatus Lokiarchaeota archaeon]|nr:class I SAM-dependent methyltransferase family protein [Candidatus Lokiarchaeota archaeon]
MGFKQKLQKILKERLTVEEIKLLPRGFQTLDKIMIIKLHPKLLNKKEIIAETCLEQLPYIKSVYLNQGKIKGQFREPENIRFLAGIEDPNVEHKEHGIIYRFNIEKIMFSKGNLFERKYLVSLVKKGETIVDMFAGIGYFSLSIGKHSQVSTIYSIELNPVSYEYLVQNIKINHLEEKIIPIHGNCKEEVMKLSKSGIQADRVIMGVFPAPKDYIKEALSLTKATGTYIHYEGVVDKDNDLVLYNEFLKIAEDIEYKIRLDSKRLIKSYGPGLYHIVYDIFVKKRINN